MTTTLTCRKVQQRQRAAVSACSVVSAPSSSRSALLALPAEEAWVGAARRFASTLLARWQLSADEQDAAVLIVGELVANSAQHGRADMTLCLSLGPALLYITVADHGRPTVPRQLSADHDPDEHGRGLDIVEALAASLNSYRCDGGRHVQAVVRIASVQPQAA